MDKFEKCWKILQVNLINHVYIIAIKKDNLYCGTGGKLYWGTGGSEISLRRSNIKFVTVPGKTFWETRELEETLR